MMLHTILVYQTSFTRFHSKWRALESNSKPGGFKENLATTQQYLHPSPIFLFFFWILLCIVGGLFGTLIRVSGNIHVSIYFDFFLCSILCFKKFKSCRFRLSFSFPGRKNEYQLSTGMGEGDINVIDVCQPIRLLGLWQNLKSIFFCIVAHNATFLPRQKSVATYKHIKVSLKAVNFSMAPTGLQTDQKRMLSFLSHKYFSGYW